MPDHPDWGVPAWYSGGVLASGSFVDIPAAGAIQALLGVANWQSTMLYVEAKDQPVRFGLWWPPQGPNGTYSIDATGYPVRELFGGQLSPPAPTRMWDLDAGQTLETIAVNRGPNMYVVTWAKAEPNVTSWGVWGANAAPGSRLPGIDANTAHDVLLASTNWNPAGASNQTYALPAYDGPAWFHYMNQGAGFLTIELLSYDYLGNQVLDFTLVYQMGIGNQNYGNLKLPPLINKVKLTSTAALNAFIEILATQQG